MPQSILEMAKDLVMAMIQNGSLSPEEMQKELQKTHAGLAELKAKEDLLDGNGGNALSMADGNGLDRGMSSPGPVDWKKSIKKHTIECLVCGASFKQLSVRHLVNHDLVPRSYRARFGILRTQPLSAKETTAMRKRIVQKSRPWEKAPTYMKARNQKAASAKPKVARAKKSVASA